MGRIVLYGEEYIHNHTCSGEFAPPNEVHICNHIGKGGRQSGRRGSEAKPRVLNDSPVDCQTPR